LKLAVSECLQNNGGIVKDTCDTLGLLKSTVGYGDGTTAPTIPYGTATLTKESGAIVIIGTTAVGTCKVTITPTITATATSVTWAYVTSGTGCTIAQTGFPTA
jgi:type IV pilus assembly protein PilA